jgi:hypothetical protein
MLHLILRLSKLLVRRLILLRALHHCKTHGELVDDHLCNRIMSAWLCSIFFGVRTFGSTAGLFWRP